RLARLGSFNWPFASRRHVVRQRESGTGVGAAGVREAVVSYAEQPRLEVAARLEPLQGTECLEERFLHQIFGHVPVACQVVQPAIQTIPVALDESCERLPPASLRGADPGVLLGAELAVSIR